MIHATLSNFIDYVTKTGTTKLGVVKKQYRENGADYHPAHDYYRGFRKTVQEMHRTQLPIHHLDELVKSCDDKKRENYLSLATGYKKYAKGLPIGAVWSAPEKVTLNTGGLAIRVNPELGFAHRSGAKVVKMYLKAPELKSKQAKVVMHLMKMCMESDSLEQEFGVLDVRRGRLYTDAAFNPELTTVVEAEALAFAAMYAQLASSAPFLARKKEAPSVIDEV